MKSYRPVSLLSCIGKVVESMVQSRIQAWAERAGIIPPSQAGFRRHRSTSDVINSIVQTAFDNLQKRHRTLLVAVDFRAAFDTVWRQGLLRKLAGHNINTRWLRWLRAFLSDRRARVRWNDSHSGWKMFKEGLPQGGSTRSTLPRRRRRPCSSPLIPSRTTVSAGLLSSSATRPSPTKPPSGS